MQRLRPPSRTVVAAMAAVAVVGVAGGGVAGSRAGSSAGQDGQSPAPGHSPGAAATVKLVGLHHGRLAWDHKATVVSTQPLSPGGAPPPEGNPVAGTLSPDATQWSSTSRLIPRTSYVAQIAVRDGGDVRMLRF